MFNYNPLVKTLKDKGIDTKELAKMAGIKEGILVTKLNSGEYISTEYLDRICTALEVPVECVMQWQKGEQKGADKVKLDWTKVKAVSDMKSISFYALSKKCKLSSNALWNSMKRDSEVKMKIAGIIATSLGCKVEDLI